PPGRGLGEVDFAQVEPGVAGAVYDDDRLIELYNTGDVYTAMAQAFYRDELPPADLTLPPPAFKKKHPALRPKMKVCTLALIYGVTAYGLARQLNCPAAQAEDLFERFMGMFPRLRQALLETPLRGQLCGYVATSTGLRRYRALGAGALTGWEQNWMTNHRV